ncbi:GNAT family N-acetyltransferase [Longispora albida]|uniref:GNAT family N-acetyltransferase n=1 Tax=Longispora albida TaxID=203523 RepID=UPI00036AE1C9|nr:GNAT family protein [Longispora albida]
MPDVIFERWVPSTADTEELADLLSGEEWPFHVTRSVSRERVLRLAATGYYDSAEARSFWIVADGKRSGLVRLMDLGDDIPMFDLRLVAAARGQGTGLVAVRWLTGYLFTEYPAITRVEGTTRRDNTAMRRVFGRAGYVKEAHYRQSWQGQGGELHDTIGYGILRADWEHGTTTAITWDDEPAGEP